MGRTPSCKYHTLGLRREQLDQKGTARVVRVIQHNENTLQSFTLDGCVGYCDVILTAVLTGTNVQFLQIIDGSVGLYALGMGLAHARCLRELVLESILDWTESVGLALGLGLECSTTLQVLSIKECDFRGSDGAFSLIAKGLGTNQSLTEFKVINSQLPDQDGSCLFDSIIDHPNLQTIDLSRNLVAGLTVLSLAKWIQREKCPLQHLHLASQDRHLHGKISPLFESLATNKSLRTLDLSDNNLDDEELSGLWKALTKNTTLQDLSLHYNGVCDEAAIDFCRNLPQLSLNCIKMYGHPFSPAVSDNLVQALECNTSLRVAALGGCSTFATHSRIRHFLNLNKAARRLCRNSDSPGLWPFALARANVLWRNDHVTNLSVIFGLLQEMVPGMVSVR